MPPRSAALESRVTEILEDVQRGVSVVRGLVIADREGRLIASTVNPDMNAESLGRASALVLGDLQEGVDRIPLSHIGLVIVEGERVKILMRSTEANMAQIVALVDPNAEVEKVRDALAELARKIEGEVGPGFGPVAQVSEVFLLDPSGILISHSYGRAPSAIDEDVLAGMVNVVGAFVKDAFAGQGGPLEEIEMANLRLRLIRGRFCTLAVIATSPIGESFARDAAHLISLFEERNREALDPWDGDPESLRGADSLVDTLVVRPPR